MDSNFNVGPLNLNGASECLDGSTCHEKA